jgi:DNA-binding LacI/PurR family transcriptional regulator
MTGPRPVRRPTIADIARRAGLTKAAVSFALNNQPGVSQATRERVLAIAREIGWQPNSAARALTDGRAGVEAFSVTGDYTAEAGARATRALLEDAGRRPTAVIYDNDLMAVSGLGEAQRMEVSVPGELAIAAWDDSVLCRLVNPPLSALTHDVAAYGAHAARVLLERASGGDPGNRVEPAAVLSVRESSRPAR